MTSDNITVIFIVFDNFKNAMEDSDFQFEKSTKMFTLMGPELNFSNCFIYCFLKYFVHFLM